jgi:uncharacterized membrane protein
MNREKLSKASTWAALFIKLRESLWLTPLIYTLGAGALAAALLCVDQQLAADTSAWYLYAGQADGARSLLSTIASSMLTIAGLVFSITILVLQLASSQFSPRVLRTFLGDRPTQRALGQFLGSFVYAMIILPRVRTETEDLEAFVPALSVYVAFVLSLVSVSFFVVYIHHMAHAVRAVNIIARVKSETRRAIERLYPDPLRTEPAEWREPPARDPDYVIENSAAGGVLISVDEQDLLNIALRRDLVIEAVPRVGDFVPEGAPLFRVWGSPQREGRSCEACVALAEERTLHQDALFGFRQLVDIAARALSPSTNDPTTAAQVLDHVHDLLRVLARRAIPSAARADDRGAVRLILPRPSFGDYVRTSFEEVRSYGASSVQVVRRTRAILVDLIDVAPPERKGPLQLELELLDRAAARNLQHELLASTRAP